MVEKLCPYCEKPSYSATDQGQWVCPYCLKDISDVSSRPPEMTGLPDAEG